jgi:F-type H+/Na+-transporting ATPase subunit alpha
VSRVGGKAQVKGMRQVAGSLRLDLAAFRELEAFAQLGTELDPATQAKLDRGARMVELLKQPQYQPMHVVDQVISIYAGTRGHLDTVPVARVREFEKVLLERIHSSHAEIWKKIDERKAIPDDLMPELDRAVVAIRDGFLGAAAPGSR